MKQTEKKESLQQLNLSIPIKKSDIRFHERIKELRKQNNITQKGLAELLGLPYMTYVAYEQLPSSDNHRLPPYEILLHISELFKVSTDYLLGITDYPFREGHSVDFSSLLYFSENLTTTEQQILEILLKKMNP